MDLTKKPISTLSFCQTIHIVLRKEPFWNAKGVLLQCDLGSFGRRFMPFCKSKTPKLPNKNVIFKICFYVNALLSSTYKILQKCGFFSQILTYFETNAIFRLLINIINTFWVDDIYYLFQSNPYFKRLFPEILLT